MKKYKIVYKDNIDYTLLGETIKTKIVERTHRGFDKNDKPFKPYSENYIKIKRKHGMNSIVNLELTGKMLDSIAYLKKGKGWLRFYLKGRHGRNHSNNQIAYYNKLKGREFLGLTKKEAEKLKKNLKLNLKNGIILKKT